MKNLITIHEWKGDQVVSARELHFFLESRQDFSDWIKNRIKKYGFVENQDYTTFHKNMERKNNVRGSTKRIEYAITLDTAKELAMIENNDNGRKVRKYFIEMEKIARQRQISLPTRKELAKMVIEAEDNFERVHKILKEKRPLISYAETVQKANDTILVRQLAKYICNSGKAEVGQNRLFKWMRLKGYLNKKNEPYQQYIDQGLFEYHETQIGTADKIFTRRTPTVTGKGRVYFIDKYLQDHQVQVS